MLHPLPEPIETEPDQLSYNQLRACLTNPVLRRKVLSFIRSHIPMCNSRSLDELWGRLVYVYQKDQAEVEDRRREYGLDVSPGWLEREHNEDLLEQEAIAMEEEEKALQRAEWRRCRYGL
jgi:hypothetical protein